MNTRGGLHCDEHYVLVLSVASFNHDKLNISYVIMIMSCVIMIMSCIIIIMS